MDGITLDLGKRLGKRKRFRARYWLHNVWPDKLLLTIIGCLFIAIVSVHDTYLVVIEENIQFIEKNPICMILIEMEPHGMSFFILGKTIGTLAVVSALLFLHRKRYAHSQLVTGAVATFQALLLIYLHFSDPKLGGLPNFALLF